MTIAGIATSGWIDSGDRDNPASSDGALMVPRDETSVCVAQVDGGGRSERAGSQPLSAQAQTVSNAAQTVAELEALTARNPDLAAELEDGLAAARAKLDQVAVDLLESGFAAGSAFPSSYVEHRAAAIAGGETLAAQYADDPIALAALDRATQTLCSPEYLREQLDIVRLDRSAYAVLQAARGQPIDPAVVAQKEVESERLEGLVAGAEAASAFAALSTGACTAGGPMQATASTFIGRIASDAAASDH